MTQQTINKFRGEFFSKPPRKNHNTNNTNVYHIDDTWIIDISDLGGFGPEKKVIDTFYLWLIT